MITLILGDRTIRFLYTHFSTDPPRADDWSQMRWIVIGPAADKELLAQISNAKDPRWQVLDQPYTIAIGRTPVDEYLSDIDLATLNMLWNLGTTFWMVQLWSERFEALFHAIDQPSWVVEQVQNTELPVYKDAISKHEKGEIAELPGWQELGLRAHAALLQTRVTPPPQIRELLALMLEHIVWLLAGRLGPGIDYERDVTIASVCLGPQFNEFLKTGKPHGIRCPERPPPSAP